VMCSAGPAAVAPVAVSSDTCSTVFVSEGQRRIEQLVLYMRALELLASALNLAKCGLADGRLSPTMLTRQGNNTDHYGCSKYSNCLKFKSKILC